MYKRTTINLDQDLLTQARQALGTKKVTETVHRSLDEVVKAKKLRSLAARDLPDLSLSSLEEMRRSRVNDESLG